MERLWTDMQVQEFRDKHHAGTRVCDLVREYAPDKEALSDKKVYASVLGQLRKALRGDSYKRAGGAIGIVPFKHVPKTDKPKAKRELKLPKDKHSEVVAMHKGGMTLQAIADAYGVDISYISKILKAQRNA